MKKSTYTRTFVTGVTAFSSVVMFAGAPLAAADPSASCTWTGAGSDSKWSTAANWQDCNDVAPVSGETIVFDSGASSSTDDIAGLSIAGFSGSDNLVVDGVTLTVTAASTGFSGSISLQNNASLVVADGASLGSASVTIAAGSSLHTEGTTTLANDISLAGSNAIVAADGTTLTLDGTLTPTADATVSGGTVVMNHLANTGFTVTASNADTTLNIAGGKGADSDGDGLDDDTGEPVDSTDTSATDTSATDDTATDSDAPATPDTGFSLVSAHPAQIMAITTVLAGAILFLSRRLATVKVKANRR